MRADNLIRSSTHGPEELRVLFQAFDDAWERIRPSVGQDPHAVEDARGRLAMIILSLAEADTFGLTTANTATTIADAATELWQLPTGNGRDPSAVAAPREARAEEMMSG